MRLLFMLPPIFIVVLTTAALILLLLCLARKKWRKAYNFRKITMLGLIILILARPVFLNGSTEIQNSNLAIFFIVDMTSSMAAKDQNNGNNYRYEQVKADINKIVNKFPGSRYSLLILDNSIYTAMPSSANTDSILAAVKTIAPKDSNYGIGTNLGTLFNYVGLRLNSFSQKNPSLHNIVFFFSDGEDNSGKPFNTSVNFKKLIDGGAIFGYGTEDGDTIHKTYTSIDGSQKEDCVHYNGNDGYTRDANNCVISKLDEDNLKKIANKLGLEYYRRDADEIPSNAINNIDNETQNNGDALTDGYIDTYWFFAMLLLFLLIWDFYRSFNYILLERVKK